MRVLAFDCAGAQCAAAIAVDGKTIAAQRVEAERGHAVLLMPLLAGLLGQAGLDFGDIDRFAVTTGPGSFTGIRVALAAALGLSIGTGKPVIGVSVFDVLAESAARLALPVERMMAVVESRRSEFFAQMFGADGQAQGEPMMATLDGLAASIGQGPVGPIAIVGDAAARLAAHLQSAGRSPAVVEHGGIVHVDVGVLAAIGAVRQPGPMPIPFYLRPPDATPARPPQ